MSTGANGSGPVVIRDAADGRYVGREPDGDTPASLCWPTKLNRHVRRFATKQEASAFIASGGDPATTAPRYIRVRPIRRTV